MLQTAADITASVHKFETILHQFKRDNLNEVDQSLWECIGLPTPYQTNPNK